MSILVYCHRVCLESVGSVVLFVLLLPFHGTKLTRLADVLLRRFPKRAFVTIVTVLVRLRSSAAVGNNGGRKALESPGLLHAPVSLLCVGWRGREWRAQLPG